MLSSTTKQEAMTSKPTARERFEALKTKYRHHSMHPDPIAWQDFHDLILLMEAAVSIGIENTRMTNGEKFKPGIAEKIFFGMVEIQFQRMVEVMK
jgi:hypothetical protein